jgi:hypothetical protein
MPLPLNMVGVARSGGDVVGTGVGVGEPPERYCTSNSARLVPASAELKPKPSEFIVSRARDINDPARAATAGVRSTSFHTPVLEPGVKLATVVPLAGLVLYVSDSSLQMVLSTDLTRLSPPEPLVTYIRSFAEITVCPASDARSKRK